MLSGQALEPGLVGGEAVESWYRLATRPKRGWSGLPLPRVAGTVMVVTGLVGRGVPQPVPYETGLVGSG